MNKLLTFEILLYLNVYYFGLYFGMEFLFLIIKYFHTEVNIVSENAAPFDFS